MNPVRPANSLLPVVVTVQPSPVSSSHSVVESKPRVQRISSKPSWHKQMNSFRRARLFSADEKKVSEYFFVAPAEAQGKRFSSLSFPAYQDFSIEALFELDLMSLQQANELFAALGTSRLEGNWLKVMRQFLEESQKENGSDYKAVVKKAFQIASFRDRVLKYVRANYLSWDWLFSINQRAFALVEATYPFLKDEDADLFYQIYWNIFQPRYVLKGSGPTTKHIRWDLLATPKSIKSILDEIMELKRNPPQQSSLKFNFCAGFLLVAKHLIETRQLTAKERKRFLRVVAPTSFLSDLMPHTAAAIRKRLQKSDKKKK